MKIRPSVSIVTPVFNTKADFLKELYESLCEQEVDWEWIIVDDFSSEQSCLLYLAELESVDVRITLVRLEQNQRGGHARNVGLRFCTSEWVKFLDSDDWLSTSLLQAEIGCVSDKTDIVISRAKAVIGNKRSILRTIRVHDNFNHRSPLAWFLTTGSGHPGALLYKRTRSLEIGGWNENLYADQDGDFFGRYISGGVTAAVNECGCSYYRQHAGERVGSNVSVRSVRSRIDSQCWLEGNYEGPDKYLYYNRAMSLRWLRLMGLSLKCNPSLASYCLHKIKLSRRHVLFMVALLLQKWRSRNET